MKPYFLSLALLAAGSAQAWDCKFEREIDVTLDLTGSEQLAVLAAAGDLAISGHSGTTAARAKGRVCASEEEWLEAATIVTEGGREARIAVALPDTGEGWSVFGSHYLYMDLEIEVPAGIALHVRDSSGEMELQGTGPVTIEDSSGDIEIEGTHGDVVLEDSSGDIRLQQIAGSVTVRHDSSGDIYGRDIQGAVVVERDSSGDIRFEDVRDDFVVENDSSGDIVADTIGGAFRVLRDGSGEVRMSAVSGAVEVPGEG
jgi:hypothetical protein